jgi:hypothetical protein
MFIERSPERLALQVLRRLALQGLRRLALRVSGLDGAGGFQPPDGARGFQPSEVGA